jgi:FAD/FMN-containing dehydrogenase
MDRRALLRRGAQLGALVTSALGTAGSLDAISAGATSRVVNATAWSSLAAQLSGSLVLPADLAYGADRLLYNSKFVGLHPAALAYCASGEDVARCVAFATDHEVDFVARSGGHSYGGYSSCAGLVIDVSRLSSITVDTTSNTAVVGAGARLIDVYNVLGARERLLPAGSCPSVGVAGLTLGGGIGVFARRYGMTSDNVRAVSLVTADARHVTANEHDYTELLWACRGGGGGNFGVATEFTFDVHPMPEVTLFTLQYPWAAAATTLEAWQRWIATAPDELWSNCELASQGEYGYLSQIAGVYCGTPAALASLLTPLERSIGASPTYRFVGGEEYIRAMMIEAGCSGLSVAACHLPSANPAGQLSRSAYSAKSSYVDGPMDHAGAAAIVDAVERLKSDAPTLGGALAFDAYGGVINRIASDATAFVHRDKLACIQATYSWSAYTSSAELAGGAAWLTWLGAEVFDAAAGAYQNYIDPTLTDWRRAYYGANLERLMKVKRDYDPEDRFHFAQSIPRTL